MHQTGNFYERPIPEAVISSTALDYHQILIDLKGEVNKESLVDVSSYDVAADSFYCTAKPPYHRAFACALPSVLVRESVAAKLAQANQILRPYDVELLVWDGWRPIELQAELWNYFIELGRSKIHNGSEDEIVRFAGTYCSDPRNFNPDDYRTWPVHNTGGAADLTLRSLQSKQELFMGTDFDYAGIESATRHYEIMENAALSLATDNEVRRNRRLLYHAMASAGFTNYPHEWWHYDYGTQMWAMNSSGADRAFYGRTVL
jgi:zinc D-Ala-D-Ala dipeptidase